MVSEDKKLKLFEKHGVDFIINIKFNNKFSKISAENFIKKIIYFGKPHPEIYKFYTNNDEKVLVIGDNIRTDIIGANNMKFDSLFIINGIHKDEFLNITLEDCEKVLEKYEAKANYFQERLTW